ncbi:MAG TPA: DUF1003 domain-containing protein [Solirubrobacteraceae bacterium]|nr:DUF1003 domain-containing protein [Solirubrobacteraceae bacterium]
MSAAETSQQPPVEKDPLRHHVAAHEAFGSAGENTFGDSFMQRVADKVASGMGTVQFVIVGSAVILGWVLINGAIPYVEHTFKSLAKGGEFDAEPWILLNLIFSGVAFYTGSLVIIAAKSEAKKNAAREVADAQHREELANTQLKLLQKNTDLTEQIHALSQKLGTLTEEVHAATCRPPQIPPASPAHS